MSNNNNVSLEMINKAKKALRINLMKRGRDAQANRKTSIAINDIRLLKRATSEVEKCYMLSINESTMEHIVDNKYNQLQVVKTDSYYLRKSIKNLKRDICEIKRQSRPIKVKFKFILLEMI